MKVKTQFSIKDLENLSDVKAHTIRIWEKRYNLLQPSRTDTNIRKYDLANLKKLLNISFLYKEGYKISKIAKLSEAEIREIIQVKGIVNKEDFAVNTFKRAMFDFDSALFAKTYDELMRNHDFRHVFLNIFMPLLGDIGRLWQTNTIDPAHESFISELIKQKLFLNIDVAQQNFKQQSDKTVVLFLPYDEIHEIGLLYAHYEILRSGFKAIYLGANIPLSSLEYLLSNNEDVIFISYMTVQPQKMTLPEYVSQFQNEICKQRHCNLWLMGQKTHGVETTDFKENISIIQSIEQLLERLRALKES